MKINLIKAMSEPQVVDLLETVENEVEEMQETILRQGRKIQSLRTMNATLIDSRKRMMDMIDDVEMAIADRVRDLAKAEETIDHADRLIGMLIRALSDHTKCYIKVEGDE